MLILTEKYYEKYESPERAKKYREWYKTAKCKCECCDIVLIIHSYQRHLKSKRHIINTSYLS